MRKLLKQWYHGKTEMVEFDNDPDSTVFICPTFVTSYHWTARWARSVVKFCSLHWQFLVSTIIALLSLAAGILALK
jgi:hypothetical protein